MGVEINYKLTGTGWAECTLHVDDAHVTVTASYLSDALDDLASAIAAALRGHPHSTARFDEEPGEYRWIFEPLPEEQVRIRVLEFPDLWGNRPDEEGQQIFQAECRLRTLAGAMISALQKLEEKYGIVGYREKWVEHDLPMNRVPELQELLEKPAETCDRQMKNN
jgi:hypothetical protein